MIGVATILVADANLLIPGDLEYRTNVTLPARLRFFNVLRDSNPDAVVLDLRQSGGPGVKTIREIRQHSPIPILVVCDPSELSASEYCAAGAAECIGAPIDLTTLGRALQHVIRSAGQAKMHRTSPDTVVRFADLTFRPYQDLLVGKNGRRIKMTSTESRLLHYLTSRPGLLRTRSDITEVLYGQYPPASARAISEVVNRLRKDIASLSAMDGHELIGTEPRRGYRFIAEVTMARSDSGA